MGHDKNQDDKNQKDRGIPVTEDRRGKTPGYDEKNPTQYPNKTPPKSVK